MIDPETLAAMHANILRLQALAIATQRLFRHLPAQLPVAGRYLDAACSPVVAAEENLVPVVSGGKVGNPNDLPAAFLEEIPLGHY